MATKKSENKKELSISVYDLTGSEVKSVDLPQELFGAKISPTTVQTYIRVYQQNQRQGTASTKTRSEVVGSTRKIYRQKGTGNARHGARKAPIFVGGGITFGPKPRDYSLKMTKKQKFVALTSSLTMKQEAGAIIALEEKAREMDGKTKTVASFLTKQKMNDKKTLIITAAPEKAMMHRATRNIQNIEMVDAKSINPYIIINSDAIVIFEDAIEQLKTHFI